MIVALVVAFAAAVAANENCETVPNMESGKFTYYICERSDSVRQFDEAQQFCRGLDTETGNQAHLVTFPDEEEFDFLVDRLNATESDDFRFYLGVYQKSKDDPYSPETGEFFWVTDDDTRIRPDDDAYWKPISSWIEEFDTLVKRLKVYSHFLLDRQGRAYPAVLLNGDLPAEKQNPSVVCASEGVVTPTPGQSTKKPGPSGSSPDKTDPELWVIIVIVAGGVFLLIVVGVVVGCCISKRQAKFHKVPQSEKVANQQELSPPPEYQA